VLDPQVIAQLLAGQRRDNALGTLTARERQLLGVMAEGHSNTAIAQRLVISASAVEKHVSNVFAKLGLPPDDAQHRRYSPSWPTSGPDDGPSVYHAELRSAGFGCTWGPIRNGAGGDGQGASSGPRLPSWTRSPPPPPDGWPASPAQA
jgi:DNA-binding CsgD family transcriptional regulator